MGLRKSFIYIAGLLILLIIAVQSLGIGVLTYRAFLGSETTTPVDADFHQPPPISVEVLASMRVVLSVVITMAIVMLIKGLLTVAIMATPWGWVTVVASFLILVGASLFIDVIMDTKARPDGLREIPPIPVSKIAYIRFSMILLIIMTIYPTFVVAKEVVINTQVLAGVPDEDWNTIMVDLPLLIQRLVNMGTTIGKIMTTDTSQPLPLGLPATLSPTLSA